MIVVLAAFVFGIFFLLGMLLTLGVLMHIWPALIVLGLWGIAHEWRKEHERRW